MGKCVFCDTETTEIVNDNMGDKLYLCSRCQNKFEKCEICGEYVLGEELAENGICDNCKNYVQGLYDEVELEEIDYR